MKTINVLRSSILFYILFLIACQSDNKRDKIQTWFEQIAPDFSTQTLRVPQGYTYDILFSEGDTVLTLDGKRTPAKGKHDFVAYIPIAGSSEHGYLYVGHESHDTNSILGDGGAGTVFEVKKIDGNWRAVSDFYAIDFRAVGGSLRNCGGTLTPAGTIFSAEECEPKSNADLFIQHSFRDTADIFGRKRYLNYGWIVEIDPRERKAVRKLWQMGRYEHEDAHCMPDGRTVYLTDDATPAVLFKFISKTPYQYEEGQLYAYRQSEDATGGEWIELPMQIDSLCHARDVAIRRGATLFVRHEWIEAVGDKIYITETGNDNIDFEKAIKMGGRPAAHLSSLKKGAYTYSDPYGRVLVLDLKTLKIEPFVEGGIIGGDTLKCFSNPDGLASISLNGKKYLVINEDINGAEGYNRNGNAKDGKVYNEVYILDLDNPKPTVKNLQRFVVGPRGCETTGSFFTPDGNTYFVSIQNPSKENAPPFNKSCVVAIYKSKLRAASHTAYNKKRMYAKFFFLLLQDVVVK
ncbi:MAG: DUF839 domain-containing protein [Chitinophagales bacterium]|nr:DUF839 domain-containing protein [Chitinophagales bacterium]